MNPHRSVPHESDPGKTPVSSRVRTRKRLHKVVWAGLVVLSFGIVCIFGNYVAWMGGVRTTAKVLRSELQRAHRGFGMLKVTVTYTPVEAGSEPLQGQVYLQPEDMSGGAADSGLEVVYKRGKPTVVMPWSVLEEKRQDSVSIVWIGLFITALGAYLQRRAKSV